MHKEDAKLEQDFIKLTPPLPFIVEGAGSGFVNAVSYDRVELRGASDSNLLLLDRLPSLTICSEDGKTYHYQNLPLTNTSGRANGATARGSFGELLSHIRKDQHISICNTKDVEASDRYNGLSECALAPMAFPELALEDIDTQAHFLDQVFAAPLLITGMTGGLSKGAEINRRLAAAAAAHNIPMGVGSQRIALDHPELASIFSVKDKQPDVFLIGNLGLSQFANRPIGEARAMFAQAVDMIEADAMALHMNALQETIQVEGDRDFRGIIDLIKTLVQDANIPVIVKEVGCGIDTASALKLKAAGISAIDVGGKGGTSWSYIEGQRALSPITKRIGETFRDFGIPTAHGISSIRRKDATTPLIATGGIRDGLMAAKAIGIGATMVGIGLPLLKAALESEQAVYDLLESYKRELRTAMICSGCATLKDLPGRTRKSRRFLEEVEIFNI